MCSQPYSSNKSKYQKFRNEYNSLIKIARKKYFHDKLTSISSNLKKTWAVVKQVLTKKQTQQTFKTMKDSDGIYSHPNQIAMTFNNFFTNIGPSLANNLPPQCESHRKFMTDTYINSFLLSPTSPSEISSTVSSLRNSKSEGLMAYASRLLRPLFTFLLPSFLYL